MAVKREVFDNLVDFGRAVGEMGVALAEAQTRIDRSTLALVAETVEWVLPAFRVNPAFKDLEPEERERAARAAAEQFAQERTVFYAMPNVEIQMQSTLNVTRTSGGLVRLIFGGSKSNSEQTTSRVNVTLAAVPVTPGLADLARARNVELQQVLIGYFRSEGLLGAGAAARLAQYGLGPADLEAAAPPSGEWEVPAWRKNLLTFKKVWNQNMRDSQDETILLPETEIADRRTLMILDELAGDIIRDADPAALEEEARILLSALTRDERIHTNDIHAHYPPDRWANTRWPQFHARVVRELGGGEQVTDPTPATLSLLRNAWKTRRKFDAP